MSTGSPSVLSQEQFTSAMVQAGLESMDDGERAKLTKVLFPETDTREVMFCGVNRTLHPLTLKWTKKIQAAMGPFSAAAIAIPAGPSSPIEGDPILTKCLTDVAVILCEAYAWDDAVKTKLQEDDVLLSEIQCLCVVQQEVQGSNDFLLAPLRLAVQIMRVRAMMDVTVSKLPDTETTTETQTQTDQNQSTSTTPSS